MPLDFSLSQFDCLIGSNMSGKSTFMRTVSTAALLAQIGCVVPAESCQISPFSQIICRIGGYDFGNSTFQTEMLDVANVLQQSANALVFLDEVGRGTDSSASNAIACAIFKHLYQKAVGMVSTHNLAVAVYVQALERRIYMMKTEVLSNDIKFLYLMEQIADLQKGCASFGCEVAALIGLDHAIVQRALAVRDEEEQAYAY